MTRTHGHDPLADVFQNEREAYAEPAAPAGAPFARQQVMYGRVGDVDLPGTLYRPTDSEREAAPAVVYLHGGGWSAGDRGQFARHAAWLAAERGLAGLCVTYRLSGEALWPACVQDALCAVRWLRAHADELGIDPERIGVAGGSAGGHLAAMVATSGHAPRWPAAGGWDDRPSHARAVALFNPVLRLVPREGENLTRESRVNLLGGAVEECPDRYTDASPTNHVSTDTAACLLMHGRDDTTVSCEQSTEFFEALIRHRVKAEMVLYENVGHGWFNQHPNFEQTLTRMAEFLDRHL